MQVLDKGFIELVDWLGDDRTIVNAARVSFSNESSQFSDKDAGLIDYLARNHHVSPFYHGQLQFKVKAPISVQRQAFKHKIGTAENSESTRYIEVHDEFYVPDVMRAQSTSNKQGSSGLIEEHNRPIARMGYEAACKFSFSEYRTLITLGVAKEQAREILPLCTYTSWCWTMSLAAAAHFIKLRDHDHAQTEIRAYAVAMKGLAAERFPVSLTALLKYR